MFHQEKVNKTTNPFVFFNNRRYSKTILVHRNLLYFTINRFVYIFIIKLEEANFVNQK